MKTAEEIIINHTGARYWDSWDLWKKQAVLTYKIRKGKVKNPGPVKAKIRDIKRKEAWNKFLAN